MPCAKENADPGLPRLAGRRQRVFVPAKFSGMENPFKPNDKVLTKIKGVEVEATVRLIWNNEVQVKCPDGSLRWRTSKTVWPPSSSARQVSPSPEPAMQALADPAPPAENPAREAGETAPSAHFLASPAPTACSGEVGTKRVKGKRAKRK